MGQNIQKEQFDNFVDNIRQKQNEEREKLKTLQVKTQEAMRSYREIEKNIAAYPTQRRLKTIQVNVVALFVLATK